MRHCLAEKDARGLPLRPPKVDESTQEYIEACNYLDEFYYQLENAILRGGQVPSVDWLELSDAEHTLEPPISDKAVKEPYIPLGSYDIAGEYQQREWQYISQRKPRFQEIGTTLLVKQASPRYEDTRKQHGHILFGSRIPAEVTEKQLHRHFDLFSRQGVPQIQIKDKRDYKSKKVYKTVTVTYRKNAMDAAEALFFSRKVYIGGHELHFNYCRK
jgi:hypothetical protein